MTWFLRPATCSLLLLSGGMVACGKKEPAPPAAEKASAAPPVRESIPKPTATAEAQPPMKELATPAPPPPSVPKMPDPPALPPPVPAPPPVASVPDTVPPDLRLSEVKKLRTPALAEALQKEGFSLGNPLFIRVFKETLEAEVWLKPAGSATYRKWKTWPIAAMSGELGPKTREGDRQAPEGFYEVSTKALNPRSSYHLSFNIGYPNAFDLAHQRTGSFIMMHGKAVSIGCFAMTDPVIEEIYLIAEAALKRGQTAFAVHVFPFRMTPDRMMQAGLEHPAHLPFWLDLRKGFTAFETTLQPPKVTVREKRYMVSQVGSPHAS